MSEIYIDNFGETRAFNVTMLVNGTASTDPTFADHHILEMDTPNGVASLLAIKVSRTPVTITVDGTIADVYLGSSEVRIELDGELLFEGNTIQDFVDYDDFTAVYEDIEDDIIEMTGGGETWRPLMYDQDNGNDEPADEPESGGGIDRRKLAMAGAGLLAAREFL